MTTRLEAYAQILAELQALPYDYMSEYSPADRKIEVFYHASVTREERAAFMENLVHRAALTRFINVKLRPHLEFFDYIAFSTHALTMTRGNLLIGTMRHSPKSKHANVWFHIQTKYTDMKEFDHILHYLTMVDKELDAVQEIKGKITQDEINSLMKSGFSYNEKGENHIFTLGRLSVHFQNHGVTSHKRLALALMAGLPQSAMGLYTA